MGQWKVEVDATVEIGQELGTILVESADHVEGTPREPVARSLAAAQFPKSRADDRGYKARTCAFPDHYP